VIHGTTSSGPPARAKGPPSFGHRHGPPPAIADRRIEPPGPRNAHGVRLFCAWATPRTLAVLCGLLFLADVASPLPVAATTVPGDTTAATGTQPQGDVRPAREDAASSAPRDDDRRIAQPVTSLTDAVGELLRQAGQVVGRVVLPTVAAVVLLAILDRGGRCRRNDLDDRDGPAGTA